MEKVKAATKCQTGPRITVTHTNLFQISQETAKPRAENVPVKVACDVFVEDSIAPLFDTTDEIRAAVFDLY